MDAIRRVRPADVDDVHAMILELAEYERSRHEVRASAEDLRAALFAPNPALFGHVAEAPDGDLAGFAVWFLNYSTWDGRHGIYLEDLYVRPQHRGSGLGRALLAALAAECVSRRLTRLQWWVLDWNAPSIGFYRSLGAQAMDEWTVMRISGASLDDLARQA
ncbi:MAG TPA: GNAT family N-acetyltransferase [Actinomycetes bacterium]|nr:GNAT family N-acetyltransferase [Actinomycetes bacterium]